MTLECSLCLNWWYLTWVHQRYKWYFLEIKQLCDTLHSWKPSHSSTCALAIWLLCLCCARQPQTSDFCHQGCWGPWVPTGLPVRTQVRRDNLETASGQLPATRGVLRRWLPLPTAICREALAVVHVNIHNWGCHPITSQSPFITSWALHFTSVLTPCLLFFFTTPCTITNCASMGLTRALAITANTLT